MLKSNLYEIVPGFIICLIVTVIVSNLTYRRNEEIESEFTAALELLEKEK